jgi:hypothetical protein
MPTSASSSSPAATASPGSSLSCSCSRARRPSSLSCLSCSRAHRPSSRRWRSRFGGRRLSLGSFPAALRNSPAARPQLLHRREGEAGHDRGAVVGPHGADGRNGSWRPPHPPPPSGGPLPGGGRSPFVGMPRGSYLPSPELCPAGSYLLNGWDGARGGRGCAGPMPPRLFP